MIYSLKGTIVELNSDSLAIETGNIGYEVLISRSEGLSVGQEITIYTHEVITEDDHYLVGFLSKLEKEAFKSLIQVKGIGPKTAITALGGTTADELFKAVQSNNTAYLKRLPGIGPKAAAQIILDLKGKLVESDSKGNPQQYEDVRLALKEMGFKVKAIDDALASINEPGADNPTIIRLALKKLRSNK
ncbi:MAG: Holliday junction branch migration protein RuvA [Bacilli bacterium]|nr:Holliday junction branch migration protein RuvA [Bacilli bacterium]